MHYKQTGSSIQCTNHDGMPKLILYHWVNKYSENQLKYWFWLEITLLFNNCTIYWDVTCLFRYQSYLFFMKQSLTLMRTNLFPIISTKQKTCIADTNVDPKKIPLFQQNKKTCVKPKTYKKEWTQVIDFRKFQFNHKPSFTI